LEGLDLGLAGLLVELIALFEKAVYLGLGRDKVAGAVKPMALLALLGEFRENVELVSRDAVGIRTYDKKNSSLDFIGLAITTGNTRNKISARHDIL
jgi:hypothetical protein